MKELAIRTLVGAAYLVVMVGCILFCKWAYFALFLFVMIQIMVEFQRMNMGKEFCPAQVLCILTGASVFTLYFCHLAVGLPARFISLAFVPLFIMMTCTLFAEDKTNYKLNSILFTSILYVALPFTIATRLVFNQGVFHGDILLCFFAMIWLSDTGAYIFGMLLGQKYGPKLCPSISPHKSWIGVGGGLLFTIGAAIAMQSMGFLPYSIGHCIALAVIVDVTGVLGDLFESQWKRINGLKDSGNIMPGHGGLFDRFDSAMMALPMAVVYMLCFNLL